MSPFLSFHLILTWVEKHSRVGVQQSTNGEVSSSISFVTRFTFIRPSYFALLSLL